MHTRTTWLEHLIASAYIIPMHSYERVLSLDSLYVRQFTLSFMAGTYDHSHNLAASELRSANGVHTHIPTHVQVAYLHTRILTLKAYTICFTAGEPRPTNAYSGLQKAVYRSVVMEAVCIHRYVYMYMCTNVSMCAYMDVCMWVCKYMCVYEYVCFYVYIHLYVHI